MSKNQILLKEYFELKSHIKNGFMLAIGGGLALDSFLHKLTRQHNDLDIDLVGSINHADGFQYLKSVLQQKFSVKENKGHLVIDTPEIVIDAEYVQELEPGNAYVFSDGTYRTPFPLYLKLGGKLMRKDVDIENPHMIFVIKLLGPITTQKEIRNKDQHDLNKLRKNLDKKTLVQALEFELNYIKTH